MLLIMEIYLLLTCPHPVTIRFVSVCSSLKRVWMQTGCINSVIQSRSINRIRAMSFFLVLPEYFGCGIISFGRKNDQETGQFETFGKCNTNFISLIIFYTRMFWFSARKSSSSVRVTCLLKNNLYLFGKTYYFQELTHTFPSRATTGRLMSLTQCAAVNTNISEMSDPPHAKLTLYCPLK